MQRGNIRQAAAQPRNRVRRQPKIAANLARDLLGRTPRHIVLQLGRIHPLQQLGMQRASLVRIGLLVDPVLHRAQDALARRQPVRALRRLRLVQPAQHPHRPANRARHPLERLGISLDRPGLHRQPARLRHADLHQLQQRGTASIRGIEIGRERNGGAAGHCEHNKNTPPPAWSRRAASHPGIAAITGPPVDLALIIALDGSASVGFEEFNLLAGGLAAALRDPEIVAGLTGGTRRSSLLSLLLWSGPGAHEIMLDWIRIASEADALAFADSVAAVPRIVRAGETAIGEALILAEQMLAALPAPATRQVIDVAGDGRSNAGPDPRPIRDRLVASGVTINGLCVLHEEPDLLRSYTGEVIGGPDAFALACANYAGFADAMRRKLVREVA